MNPFAQEGTADFVLIGTVRKVRGSKGDLKVQSLSDVPARFTEMKRAFLRKRNAPEVLEYEVERIEMVNDYVVLKLKDVSSFEVASSFVGAELLIPESERGTLPANTYFIDSLIGMNVRDLEGNMVGIVSDVISNSAQNLLLVNTPGGQVFNLPFVNEFVKKVNLENKEIKVWLIEGMVEGGID